MSGYEKPQESYVYGYTHTRPGQEQSYAGPTQPSFNPRYPSTQADESHALISTHQMPYLGQPFAARDTGYQASPTSLIDARTRPSPEITSTGPYTGKIGETFRLSVRSEIDYTTQNFSFTILFGNTAAAASLIKNSYREPYHHYTLHTTVPPNVHIDQAQQLTMPLLLDVQDENGQSISMKSLDNFTYIDTSPFPRYAAPLEVQKKRKYAEDTTEYSQLPAKRSASTPLQPRSQGVYPSTSDGSSYNFESAGLYALPTVYDRPASQQRPYMPSIAQRPSYVFSGSPPMRGAVKGRSPSMGGYAGYSSIAQPSPSPRLSVAPHVGRTRTARVSSSSSNPPLIRTSILQPQASSSFRTPGFNPYTIYPSAKAKLEIQGDLMSMAVTTNWTEDEKKIKRRLVEFHRRQEDSIIHATFKPVTVEERSQGTHCVSCISWEERGECFVTSVDTIQLLEGLVGVRFTVEEKNRIRRNLEGFKPLTVSKQKEDSESFFRLIMGFPNPKPRNIEKDVKVFPWSILSNALRKIIGKYSASYASTSAILTPSTSVGFVSSMPEAGIEHLPTASPRSTTSSAASNHYQGGVPSTVVSGNVPGRPTIDVTASPYEPLRQTSQPMSAISPWAAQYPSVTRAAQYTTGHGTHSGRTTWDMGPYAEQQLSSSTSQQLQYYPGNGPAEHDQPTAYPTHSQAPQ